MEFAALGFYLIFAPALFLVASLYAAVGLGGGTAYLSLLSFWTIEPATLRPMAWGLNVVVATVGIVNYAKQKHISLPLIWHYLVGGLAGAAVGAAIPISDVLFRWLLALTLATLAVRMLLAKKKRAQQETIKSVNPFFGLLLGFVPGVLSGIVGIGGGIILGPIILALGLLPMKKCAGMTVLYIWVCSAGALGTHFGSGGTLPWAQFFALSAVVVVGGYLGSRYGAGKANPTTLQRTFGIIVLIAAINLTIKAINGG